MVVKNWRLKIKGEVKDYGVKIVIFEINEFF